MWPRFRIGDSLAHRANEKAQRGAGLIDLDDFLFAGLWRGINLASINGVRPHHGGRLKTYPGDAYNGARQYLRRGRPKIANAYRKLHAGIEKPFVEPARFDQNRYYILNVEQYRRQQRRSGLSKLFRGRLWRRAGMFLCHRHVPLDDS